MALRRDTRVGKGLSRRREAVLVGVVHTIRALARTGERGVNKQAVCERGPSSGQGYYSKAARDAETGVLHWLRGGSAGWRAGNEEVARVRAAGGGDASVMRW